VTDANADAEQSEFDSALPVKSKNTKPSKKSSATKVCSFLSWNLCLLQNSHQAPSSWRIDLAEAKVRERVLELAPDFVCFQELPGLVPYVETHDLIPANTTSHSGNIATIVKKELMNEMESKTIGRFAVVSRFKSRDLTVANVHLEPGSNGGSKRLSQLKRIVSECKTSGLLIVGDTNTRTSEEDSFEQIGLVGKRPPTATWNSKINLFRDDGRKYTAYYTRFFHSQNLATTNVKVWNQPIESDGKKFHLSDHFAMSGSVESVLTGDRK
jgi:endonuclease/exonuclease/phosphatase family metal-dependent hydrolase